MRTERRAYRDHPDPRPFLAGAVACEVAATLALKAALDRPSWYLLVVTGYLAAFALLAGCLRRGMAVGVAYGLWGAGGVVLTAILANRLHDEPLTALTGLGLALVVVGVLAVEVGAHGSGEGR